MSQRDSSRLTYSLGQSAIGRLRVDSTTLAMADRLRASDHTRSDRLPFLNRVCGIYLTVPALGLD